MSDVKLIQLLADGEFHSGEEVGALLGVSRTAVWKQVKKLEGLDLPLEAQRGKGYRLVGGLDLLSVEVIRSFLSAAVAGRVSALEVFAEIDSTNRHAAARAVEGGAHGYVCLAEQQLAGRGRRGRGWCSPFGRNIYLSLVWEFQSGAAALEGLSLCVGIAVARALAGFGVSGVQLKWPNDVLCGDRKLAGILLEMQGDPAGLCQVIVGIGVNLDMHHGDTSAITQPWVDLYQLVGVVDRNRFAAVLVDHLVHVLDAFAAKGFAGFRNEWESLDAYLGREVMIQLGERWIAGVARGVDAGGGLVLDVDGQRQVFRGGEISLRAGR